MELRLILNVKYNMNGTTSEELQDLLQTMIHRALGEGLITGETPAEVEEHKVSIEKARDSIYLKWGYQDIQDYSQQNGLNIHDEDAKDILANIERLHDASIGVNWDVINYHVSEYADSI